MLTATPWAEADFYRLSHDQATAIDATHGVLANDQDDDQDPLSAVLVSGPTHGALTLSADGSFEYTPDAAYLGDDSFTYIAHDGTNDSWETLVRLEVVNHRPVAAGNIYSISHDAPLVVDAAEGVLANDFDLEGDVLTATLLNTAANGSLTLNADGSFSYTPDPDFVGVDQFTYQVNDGLGDSRPTTVTILVGNAKPVAVADSYRVNHEGFLDVAVGDGVLQNDLTEAGETLAAGLTTDASYGNLTFNPDGSFTYTPDAGYVGLDSFTYRVSDGLTDSELVTVSIEVTNAQPLAWSDVYHVVHDTVLEVDAVEGLLQNDEGEPGETLTASLVKDVEHGTLTLNADGSFVYTPDPGYNGSDSFRYRTSDGLLNSWSSLVTLIVEDPIAKPQDDRYFMAVDDSLAVSAANGVLANDDVDPSEPLEVLQVRGVHHGTLTLNSDGSFSYTPNAGFAGVDSFLYEVFDGATGSHSTEVYLEVTAETLRARDRRFEIVHDQTLDVASAEGVLKGAWHVDGLPLSAVLVQDVQHGTLVLNADGSFIYTPDAGYAGSDGFTYRVNDGTESSTEATVNLEVTNQAPRAFRANYFVVTNTPLEVEPSLGLLFTGRDEDEDDLSVLLDTGPNHGILVLNADGSFTYTPDENYEGSDGFTFRITDGIATSAAWKVTLTVDNTAPIGSADTYQLSHGRTLEINAPQGVLQNDRDSEFQELAADLITGPAHGALQLNADGSFAYTPDAGYVGNDTFVYRANDGQLQSQNVTVTLQVVNSPAIAKADTYYVSHGQALTVSAARGVLANDFDADGDPLSAVLNGSVSGLTFREDGSFTYLAPANAEGEVVFGYRANDGGQYSDYVSITIIVQNTPPVARNDQFHVHQGNALVVGPDEGLLWNDGDIDGHDLSATVLEDVSNGYLVLGSDGSFSYTPGEEFVGTDRFTYTISDGVATATAVVLIDVRNTNPWAIADRYFVHQGTPLTVTVADGVLNNDDDLEDDLVAVLLSDVSNGYLELQDDGSFVYTPGEGFVGEDTFPTARLMEPPRPKTSR